MSVVRRPTVRESRLLVQNRIKDIGKAKADFLRTTENWLRLARREKLSKDSSKSREPSSSSTGSAASSSAFDDLNRCCFVLDQRMSMISHIEAHLAIARSRGEHPMHDYGKRKDLELLARNLVGVSATIPDPFHPYETQALPKVIEFCQASGAVAYDFEIAKYENCLRSPTEMVGATSS